MKFVRLCFVPLALLCVGIIRLLARRGFLVRFGESWAHRIGHLAGNNETYLCERDAGMHPHYDIFCHRYGCANKQLVKMFNRVMRIDRTNFTALVALVNRMFHGWEKHVAESTQLDRDVHNLYEKYPPHVYFTEREKRRGERALRKMGIPPGAKWVCLMVRDMAYLPNLTYHSHRNSDIGNYIPAMLELANRGYYVIRMGEKVGSYLNVVHSKVIDYATNGMRSDFMDIYLGAHCEFAVSSGTGMDAVPLIFRRPVCYVNFIPMEYMMTWLKNSIVIWRHHIKDGKRMTPQEIYKSGAGHFMRADEYKDAGITLEENTAQEIYHAVIEMMEPCDDDQSWFWSTYQVATSPYNGKPLHGKFRSRICAKFLKQYEPVPADRAA